MHAAQLVSSAPLPKHAPSADRNLIFYPTVSMRLQTDVLLKWFFERGRQAEHSIRVWQRPRPSC